LSRFDAVADHGGHLREEVVARAAVLEPEPLALTLECTPSSAGAGEDVLWRLTVGNRGSVPLVGVTAVGPEGRQLDRSADLARGERRVPSRPIHVGLLERCERLDQASKPRTLVWKECRVTP
jgi:hypothetical protein